MNGSPAVFCPAIDAEQVGVLLANMLADWLEGNQDQSFSREIADEFHHQRATPEQDGVCVRAAVDDGAGAPSPGEHGAAVCSAREGSGVGLERACSAGPGSRPGQVGSPDGGTGGLQDAGGGSLDGACGSGICAGGVAAGTLQSGLAAVTGVVRPHRYAGNRRGWLLQPERLQRWTSVGVKGDDGSGRTSFIARAPPGWQAQ